MTWTIIGRRGGIARCAVALAAVMVAGCVAPPGHIVGALPDTSFVGNSEQRYLFSEEHGGWLVIGLNGQIQRRLFDAEYHIEDISSDGRTFVLRNSDTDLFIARDGGQEIREVPEFRGLLGAVGLAPDGSALVATKHPDFDQPQDQWVDDEQLYLIETNSLAVSPVGRFSALVGRPPFDLVWLDDHHVLLRFFATEGQQIDVRTGAHDTVSDGMERLRDSQRWKTAHAESTDCGWELHALEVRDGRAGIDLVGPDDPPRQIVEIAEARPPHPHEVGDGVSDPSFTRDCGYVTFRFHNDLWVVEISSGKVGPILPGRDLTFERWYPIGLP